MTTDPNWLKSLTESYKQEVSESARNLQEEADQIMNLVETIQTALNVDLTEEQVDALIEAFRSTIDPETGEHKAGLIRKMLGVLGHHVHPTTERGVSGDGTPYSSTGFGRTQVGTFGRISKTNQEKQTKIHKANDEHNDQDTDQARVLNRANFKMSQKEKKSMYDDDKPPVNPFIHRGERKNIKYGD